MKKELPQCSVDGCLDAAGIIMNGTLLCGAHANEALERRRADLKRLRTDEPQ
jgi:hypothetical protein